jgi:dihydroxyacetone synthase
MPGLVYMRPCDGEELLGCWMHALRSEKNPTMLSLARDPVGPVPNTHRSKVERGAYVISEPDQHGLTLASCGSNLHYAVAAADTLATQGVQVRIVSAPCLDLFEVQDADYKHSVFPLDGRPIVSVEEYVATTWARYATASIGMTSFGYSASNASNYERFGLDTKGIVVKVQKYLEDLKGQNARLHGWKQL